MVTFPYETLKMSMCSIVNYFIVFKTFTYINKYCKQPYILQMWNKIISNASNKISTHKSINKKGQLLKDTELVSRGGKKLRNKDLSGESQDPKPDTYDY